jgi:signal transduction histidine kinase
VDKNIEPGTPYRFLQNCGEMGRVILDHDWSQSSIGSISEWPHSLLITLANILHSNFPQFLFWGEDLICFYNDAYRPSLGQEGKHPAIGKSGSMVWPEIWDDIHPLIQQVLTTGTPAWFEDRLLPIFRNNHLEDVYWTFSYSPAFGDEGKIVGVLVTCMETTKKVAARKEAEGIVSEKTKQLERAHESLLRANVYLQQIINSFKEPLQVLEPVFENGEIVDFRFKLTNAAYSAYANTTPENLYGKKVGDVFPGYFQTSSFTNVAKTCKTGVADTWELHYDQDGLDLYNEMSAARLGDEVIVHFTDFTKLKHLQIELVKKIEELERSNRNLEEFANAASHDLKEPIRKITLFTSQLKDKLGKYLQPNELEIFSKIENATARMNNLIEDIMQYSQVNHQPVEKEDVNLKEKLKQVLEDLELVIQQKNAIVKVQDLPLVKGYSRQLQQLFQNLISNSLKYCKEDIPPEILIISGNKEEDGKNYVVIEVRDNGIGFDPKFKEEIFQMFTRLHGRNQYHGNGIGLSIVKKIVQNHRGKIAAESKVGNGSTFKVYLPVE